MKRVLLAACAFVATLGMAIAATPGLKSGAFDPARVAPEFALNGSDGKQLTLARFRGKLVVLEFGYTSCPDVCPVTLATLAQARKKLGAAAERVQVIFVTVDPERDTPGLLRRYLAAFDSSFIGASGTPQQLARVRQDYGITVTDKTMAKGSKTAYSLGHSSSLYLVDPQGRLRAMAPYGSSADDLAHDMRLLLRP